MSELEKKLYEALKDLGIAVYSEGLESKVQREMNEAARVLAEYVEKNQGEQQ